jgi:hypothetical protein
MLEKRLAAQSNATPDGYEALKTKLANLGASMTALQGQVGSIRHAGKGDRGGTSAAARVGAAAGVAAEAAVGATAGAAAETTAAVVTVAMTLPTVLPTEKRRRVSPFGSIASLRRSPCCRPPRFHGILHRAQQP